jgi:multiple sugar transport system substrate-binding protein
MSKGAGLVSTELVSRRMTRRIVLKAALLSVAAVVPLLQGCASPQAPPSQPSAAQPAESKPAEAKPPEAKPAEAKAPAAPATKKWDGVELRYAGIATMGELLEERAKPWLDERGVRFNRAGFGQQEIEEKILQSMSTNTYFADLIQFNANSAGDVMGGGWLLEVPEQVKKAVDMDDVLPLYRDRILSWGGKQYALPYDGDKHMLGYLGHLFANPENQTKFKTKYGYDLPQGGPRTWEEHRQIAEFFTGWDWNGNGKPDEAGIAHMTKRKDTAWWGFNSRASAYVKHPDDPGTHFEVETFEPRINSPAFVRALTEWKEELEKFGLPGATDMKWSESGEAFRGERVAMSIGWWGVAESDPSRSVIREKLRYAILPGSKEVYNARAKRWDTVGEINYAPYIAFGGWVFAVPKNSRQPELAFEFASYIASREMSLTMVTNPTGAQPFRFSHLANVADWTEQNVRMDKAAAESYLAAEKATMDHKNLMVDLRIPGFTQYRDAAELAIGQALAGEKSPQEALDACAEAWKEITQRVGGVERQKELYRAAVTTG